MNDKIVVWKDGSYLITDASWEYENDMDWLTTVKLSHGDIAEILRQYKVYI